MHGILNVYKPSGISSNFCLVCLKKQLNIKKLGHLGTLDPLACGVLPVAVNKATKLFDFYLNKNKKYLAEFTFGFLTDTLDLDGKVIGKSNKIPSKSEIEEKLPKLIGKISQIPPKFSAKNINGKRAYDLARNGEDFTLEPKEVVVYDFKIIKQIDEKTFLFEILCSSGTYIRSLARDLGTMLGTCATMTKLTRTQSGEFKIEDATNFKEINSTNVKNKIISLEKLLSDFKTINLDEKYFKKLSNGVQIETSFEDCNLVVVYCNKILIGLGEIKEKMLKIKTNLIA